MKNFEDGFIKHIMARGCSEDIARSELKSYLESIDKDELEEIKRENDSDDGAWAAEECMSYWSD